MRADAIPEGEYKTYKLRRIIVVIKTFGIYMSRMIIYNKPLFYSNKLYFWGINKNGNEDAYKINNDFFLGIILIICSICCFNYIPYEYRNVYIFMLLATIQWCNIITVTQTIADRYMSLPNVFMMLFISYAIHKHFPNNAESILFSLLVFYAIRLYDCMKMYRNITSFYDYHIYNNNKDVSCRIFKATDCMLNNDFMRAFTILREGLHYVPNDFKLLFQSACCCFRLGDKSNAKELLNKAENNYYIGQEDSLKEKVDKIKPYL